MLTYQIFDNNNFSYTVGCVFLAVVQNTQPSLVLMCLLFQYHHIGINLANMVDEPLFVFRRDP